MDSPKKKKPKITTIKGAMLLNTETVISEKYLRAV